MTEGGLESKAFWKDAPVVPEEWEWVYSAYWGLSGSRRFSGTGGVGAIPFEVVDSYAMRMGIEGDAFEEFWLLFQAMDHKFLAYFREKGGKT